MAFAAAPASSDASNLPAFPPLGGQRVPHQQQWGHSSAELPSSGGGTPPERALQQLRRRTRQLQDEVLAQQYEQRPCEAMDQLQQRQPEPSRAQPWQKLADPPLQAEASADSWLPCAAEEPQGWPVGSHTAPELTQPQGQPAGQMPQDQGWYQIGHHEQAMMMVAGSAGGSGDSDGGGGEGPHRHVVCRDHQPLTVGLAQLQDPSGPAGMNPQPDQPPPHQGGSGERALHYDQQQQYAQGFSAEDPEGDQRSYAASVSTPLRPWQLAPSPPSRMLMSGRAPSSPTAATDGGGGSLGGGGNSTELRPPVNDATGSVSGDGALMEGGSSGYRQAGGLQTLAGAAAMDRRGDGGFLEPRVHQGMGMGPLLAVVEGQGVIGHELGSMLALNSLAYERIERLTPVAHGLRVSSGAGGSTAPWVPPADSAAPLPAAAQPAAATAQLPLSPLIEVPPASFPRSIARDVDGGEPTSTGAVQPPRQVGS